MNRPALALLVTYGLALLTSASSLGQQASPRESLPDLLKNLISVDEKTRTTAQQKIKTLSSASPKEVVTALTEGPALHTRKAEDQVRFLEGLRAIGPPAKEALPEVLKCLEKAEAHSFNYFACRKAIQAIDPTGALVGEALRDKIAKENPRNLIALISKLREQAKVLVPAITQKLAKETDPDEAADLVALLGMIGPDAKEATALVEKVLGQAELTAFDAVALWRLKGEQKTLRDLLVNGLNSPSERVRVLTVGAIMHLGPEGKSLVPDVVAYYDKTGDRMGGALVNMGPAAQAALPALFKLSQKGDVSAAIAMTQIDPEGKQIVPWFIKSIESGVLIEQGPALFGLAVLGPRAKEALPSVLAMARKNATDRLFADTVVGLIDQASAQEFEKKPKK